MTFPGKKSSCKEKGAVLVISLVLTSALLMMGSLAIMLTITESNISRNHKMAKEAFYLSEAGHPLAVKVIEDLISDYKRVYPGFIIEENLGNEVMAYYKGDDSLNDKDSDSPRKFPDIKTTLLQQSVSVDIDRIHTVLLSGGSAEFASGGEGIGFGGGASKKVLFEINSQGSLKSGALSSVKTVYRKVL
jgi:hypothetical protein